MRTKNDIDRALSRWFLMNRGLINFSSAKAGPCFFRAQNSAEKNFAIKPMMVKAPVELLRVRFNTLSVSALRYLEPSVREMISYFREYPKPKH